MPTYLNHPTTQLNTRQEYLDYGNAKGVQFNLNNGKDVSISFHNCDRYYSNRTVHSDPYGQLYMTLFDDPHTGRAVHYRLIREVWSEDGDRTPIDRVGGNPLELVMMLIFTYCFVMFVIRTVKYIRDYSKIFVQVATPRCQSFLLVIASMAEMLTELAVVIATQVLICLKVVLLTVAGRVHEWLSEQLGTSTNQQSTAASDDSSRSDDSSQTDQTTNPQRGHQGGTSLNDNSNQTSQDSQKDESVKAVGSQKATLSDNSPQDLTMDRLGEYEMGTSTAESSNNVSEDSQKDDTVNHLRSQHSDALSHNELFASDISHEDQSMVGSSNQELGTSADQVPSTYPDDVERNIAIQILKNELEGAKSYLHPEDFQALLDHFRPESDPIETGYNSIAQLVTVDAEVRPNSASSASSASSQWSVVTDEKEE